VAAVPFRPLCVRTARGGERRCGARPGRCGRSERARALGPVSAGGSAAISDLGWHTVSGVELVNLAGRPQGITYLPPETPLGECAPDRPHLRPLHASARPDPPIRLCAQVRQNCYTCAPLCALRLYVTCCITGRIAIKKVHKNHRRISRSSAGMQPGVGKLEK